MKDGPWRCQARKSREHMQCEFSRGHDGPHSIYFASSQRPGDPRYMPSPPTWTDAESWWPPRPDRPRPLTLEASASNHAWRCSCTATRSARADEGLISPAGSIGRECP